MSFLKYLKEKGILSDSSIAHVICHQMNGQASFLEVIDSNAEFDNGDYVEAYFKHLDSGEGFLSALQSVLGQEKFNSLRKLQVARMPSIFDVIRDLHLIEFEDLKSHLNDYVMANSANVEEPYSIGDVDMTNVTPMTPQQKSEESPAAEPATEDVAISAAALESLKELGIDPAAMGATEPAPVAAIDEISVEAAAEVIDVDNALVSEFLSVFDEKKKKKIDKIMSIMQDISNSKSDVSNFVSSLYREIHMIKGAVCMIEASHAENLVNSIELEIEKTFSMGNNDVIGWVTSKSGAIQRALDILWEIRSSYEKGIGEVSYFKESSDSSEKFNKVISDLAS